MRLGCFLALMLWAEALTASKLYLKTRVIDTSGAAEERGSRPRSSRSQNSGRAHLLIQLDHTISQNDVKVLSDRGAVITGYVHQNGLVVVTSDAAALADLGLLWSRKLEATDKISPLLSSSSVAVSRPVLVEFHDDVSLGDARLAVAGAGALLSDTANLGGHRLLLSADGVQISALAGRDAVAYIFPASDDLVAGRLAVACASGLTAVGPAGQYIPVVGDGWGGTTHSAATLGYSFSKLTAQLPGDSARSEILRAFNEWAKYVKVTFTPISSATALQSIDVLFATGDHGDGYPFDGAGGVLAHTFYPSPPNPEPLAGDMHFDDAETWQIGAGTDLFSVALHETGHALGLGHADQPGAVMYPYYSRVTGLSAADIAAIRELYPAQDSASEPTTPATPLSLTIGSAPSTTTASPVTLTGSASGGTGTVSVAWSTDHGTSGAAQGSASWSAQVPLVTGSNTITVTAADSTQSTVSKSAVVTLQAVSTPVSIQVTSPAASSVILTTESSLDLSGTASHSSGIRAVTWSNDRGGAGQATGTTSWDSGPITLYAGTNNITVQATANDGTSAAQVVAVSYTIVSTGTPDTTAPSITITTPPSSTYTTSADSIVLRGTASDNVGVTTVTWSTLAGASGVASGTTSWVTSAIPLITGYNTIQVQAYDAAGNVAWRVVGVTRN